MNQKNVQTVHRLFQIGVILKALNGLLEIIGGIFLFIFGPAYLSGMTRALLGNELLEDPGDLIANYALKLVSELSLEVQIFAALYLLIHGLIKVGLVAALWRKKLWAYPLSEVILIIFMASQIYAYYFSHSLLMLALTILDAFVIVLIWLEYNHLKKQD